MTYEQLIAYIDGLYADGSLSEEDYNKIILYILANGNLENSPRDLIQIRRGLEENLPNLAQGELAFTLDTMKFFVGGSNGNVNMPSINSVELAVNLAFMQGLGNGINDDAIAFRKAINELKEKGGGTLYLPPNKTLLFKSTIDKMELYNGYYAVELFSNIRIKGYNTTIKFDNGYSNKIEYGLSSGGNGFIAHNQENIEIDGINFDYNGENNLQPSSPLRTFYGFVFVGGQNVTIKNCSFLNNPGNNTILFKRKNLQGVNQPKHLKANIINCLIKSFGADVQGNTNKLDSSAIYSEWEYTYYNNVSIINNNSPSKGLGGIEIHASHQTIENCYIEKCYPAIYIVNDYTNQITIKQIVKNNTIIKCHGGVTFWNLGDIAESEIKDNIINIEKSPFLTANPSGIYQFSNAPVWTKISDSVIKNNTIYEFDSLVRNSNLLTGIDLTTLKNVEIKDNIIRNLSGYGIAILGNTRLKNTLKLENNLIEECFMNEENSSRAYVLFNITSFEAELNILKNTFKNSNALNRYAFNFSWDTPENVITSVKNNVFTSILKAIGSRVSDVKIVPFKDFATTLLGYYSDEEGILTQWTRVNVPTANVNATFNFPVAFKNDKISIQLTNALDNLNNVTLISYTNTSFTIKSNGANVNFHVRAIGEI
jgi:hypothetical protein